MKNENLWAIAVNEKIVAIRYTSMEATIDARAAKRCDPDALIEVYIYTLDMTEEIAENKPIQKTRR